jgi:hypothetical protein
VQRLLGAGAYDLRTERLDGTVGDGPADRAAGLTAELTGTPVDHERDVPVRVGVVVRGTRPVHLVLVVSAFAVDCWSIATLRQDLAALLPGGEPPDAPPPRQPAGMVGWEQSAAGARTQEEALEFWRDRLAEMPRTLFPVSPESPDPAADPHWLCRFDSTPTAVGCTLLSTRYRVSTGHVLLAGLAAVLGAHSGVAACPLGLIVNNRMADPAAVGSAMLYMQEGICAERGVAERYRSATPRSANWRSPAGRRRWRPTGTPATTPLPGTRPLPGRRCAGEWSRCGAASSTTPAGRRRSWPTAPRPNSSGHPTWPVRRRAAGGRTT